MYLACQIDRYCFNFLGIFFYLEKYGNENVNCGLMWETGRPKEKQKIKNKNRANKYSVLKYKKNSQLITGKKNYSVFYTRIILRSCNILWLTETFWDVIFVKREVKSYSEINMKLTRSSMQASPSALAFERKGKLAMFSVASSFANG